MPPQASHPVQPYPGLRYYDDTEADFFAGRHREAQDCTHLLWKSRVLVLHGRSGCGKSSFLRAGVRPLLEQADPSVRFGQDQGGFEVIRSTIDPLGAFARRFLQVIDELIENKKGHHWQPKEAVTSEDLKQFKATFASKKAKGLIATRGRHAYNALVAFSQLSKHNPVFVIDQAEEVLTLREKRERALEVVGGKDKEAEAELRDLRRQQEEYFKFLSQIAKRGADGARLVVSLRTEYKGQFDDHVSHFGHPGDGLKGYYLSDLDEEGLVAAIVRPTLQQKEWDNLYEKQRVRVKEPPYSTYRFRFDDGVAYELARTLKHSDRVPEGGVLPTLQISCIRLWEQAQASRATGYFVIKDLNRLNLGNIDSQVHEFVARHIQEICSESREWPHGPVNATEDWLRILFRNLVDLQADGRAMTAVISRKDLVDAASQRFNGTKLKEQINQVIDRLLDDDVALLRQSEDGLTLGHDAVALSLNKWSLRYDRRDGLMMRMSMGNAKSPADLDKSDLFPSNSEPPHSTHVVLHEDLHWDRLFPHFAATRGFAKRLGIVFETDRKSLKVSTKRRDGGPRNWPDLANRLRKAGDDAYKARIKPRRNERVLVAADWHSFPSNPLAEDSRSWSEEERKEWHNTQAQRWCDILVTDLFIGNGLVGPNPEWRTRLTAANDASPAERPRMYRSIVREALMEVVEEGGEIHCQDDHSKSFLEIAATMVSKKGDRILEYVSDAKNVSTHQDHDFTDGDPLLAWLFATEDEGRRKKYIVGSVLARAMALQAGHTVYFGTGQLTLLARAEINQVRSRKDHKQKRGQKDPGQLVQEVIKHTSWQLSMSPAQWDQGRNRALALRLAAVGYFTVEYIRGHADEFVLFINDHLNSIMKDSNVLGPQRDRGMRLNRDSIHAAMKECFDILKFDEYGTEFYDLDSTVAYWTNHAEHESKSVAGEIYNELAALRQRTISHYETVSRIIAWLRGRKAYDLGDSRIRKAIELKECSWNNFKIYNFYDSARFMAEAALILQKMMETVTYDDE